MRDESRFPWRWVGWGLLALTLLTIVTGWMWLRSERDLELIGIRMRKLGLLPATEKRRPVADPVWKAAQAQVPSSIGGDQFGVYSYALEWEPGHDAPQVLKLLSDLQVAFAVRSSGYSDNRAESYLLAAVARGTRREMELALTAVLTGRGGIPDGSISWLASRMLRCYSSFAASSRRSLISEKSRLVLMLRA